MIYHIPELTIGWRRKADHGPWTEFITVRAVTYDTEDVLIDAQERMSYIYFKLPLEAAPYTKLCFRYGDVVISPISSELYEEWLKKAKAEEDEKARRSIRP